MEFKVLSTGKHDTVVNHIVPANQSTRYVVRLTAQLRQKQVEAVLADCLSQAEGLLEELVFITNEDVYRWKR